MRPVEKILVRLNGLQYPQEYLCLDKKSFSPILKAYLTDGNRIIKNITDAHLFTGYSPLIFTLASDHADDNLLAERIELLFTHKSLGKNEILPSTVAAAGLRLKRIHVQPVNGTFLFLYEGEKGWHRFIPRIGQWAGQLRNKLFNKKPGNVFLQGNLYRQVQLAYAIPRKICLVTVGEDNLYNIFPTDLHGAVNDSVYVMSLRHEGRACSQVEAAGRIVLSEMEPQACKRIFSLGKNHMQPLKESTSFDLDGHSSRHFQLPLPKDAVAYFELELISAFTHGIHKLLFFKIIGREELDTRAGTLAHIHNTYATWRHKNGLKSNYILR
jgi:flavin reductase (DIM6/NTAB) family NADH-FMN oxidoreductase RutF